MTTPKNPAPKSQKPADVVALPSSRQMAKSVAKELERRQRRRKLLLLLLELLNPVLNQAGRVHNFSPCGIPIASILGLKASC